MRLCPSEVFVSGGGRTSGEHFALVPFVELGFFAGLLELGAGLDLQVLLSLFDARHSAVAAGGLECSSRF